MTTAADILDVLLAIHHERPYALRVSNDALVHASRLGYVRRLHDGPSAHSVGAHLEVWKDLALTERGMALVHSALLGP